MQAVYLSPFLLFFLLLFSRSILETKKLLPNTNKQGAYKIATQIREDVEKMEVQVASDCSIKLTMSGGVCTLLFDKDIKIDQVLHRADKALYIAKETGRNTIVLSTQNGW